MNSLLEPGSYVVAVSGGVDSMALLHMLAQQPELKLTVAHFDHGIRSDSAIDRELVEDFARVLGLAFEYQTAQLGPNASEAVARFARYTFLHELRQKLQATAVVTAHHRDDVLETAIMSLMRNGGRKGVTSLDTHPCIARPLLHMSKDELVAYAQENALQWREDSTNTDVKYARNYIRHKVLPRISEVDQQKLIAIIEQLRTQNTKIDTELAELLLNNQSTMNRQWFTCLPHDASTEIMAAWLRKNEARQLTHKLVERLTIVAKTAANNSSHDVYGGVTMLVQSDTLALKGLER